MNVWRLFAAACLLLGLAGCSLKDEQKENPEEQQQHNQAVEVDKGLLSVEVTVPAALLDEDTIDQTIAEAEEEGIAVTKNEDGSLTYKMSKAEHKELMKDMRDGLQETVEELQSGEDYPSLRQIEHDKQFTQFIVTVEREAFENSFDGFLALGLGMGGMYYQLFDGVKADENKVVIEFKDERTGEVFSTATYPDDLPNFENEQ